MNATVLIAARAICTGAAGLLSLMFYGLSAAGGLQPFSGGSGSVAPAPWRVVSIPGGKIPPTQFDLVMLDGRRVLRVRADRSYANLSHAIAPDMAALQPGTQLQWTWRLDEPVANADLRRKEGDDVAIKVCALFDLPLEKIGFLERNLLRLARSKTGEYLPGATLCYIWDPSLTAGSVVPNAYTRRVRYLVLDSAATAPGQWSAHSRHLGKDFLQAFGDDTDTVPPLLSILVGADTDNTQGRSLAYVGDVSLVKQ
jgi:hypothetical protein